MWNEAICALLRKNRAQTRIQVKTPSSSLICFEDDDLLVINKPAGMNTHAPAPYSGEGIYDWLRNREPRWGSLAIIHRLDKETSGLLAFSKTPGANRSLTQQFAEGRVKKSYVLVTDRPLTKSGFVVKSALVRTGERYRSRPAHAGRSQAQTRFRILSTQGKLTFVRAEPLTGRTHQIRAHAAESGIPILGDCLYGGSSAPRLYLHSELLEFEHPVTHARIAFEVPADFEADPRLALHKALISTDTEAWRVVHGASDGWPGWYVDRLGDYLLSQSENELNGLQKKLLQLFKPRGIYHRTLTRQVRGKGTAETSPQLIDGEAPPERLGIIENGIRYQLSFSEGYSVGLFLDQRDNRRRLLTNHITAGFAVRDAGLAGAELLNTFAYTCAFSVCAAKAGAQVTSLDLSRKYLDWGRRNFELNGLDPAEHDFIYGDAFDWMCRLQKKGKAYDIVILDPPTFSQSRQHGVFRAEKDYGQLVGTALPLLKPGGILFASTNAANWRPEEFLAVVRRAIAERRRGALRAQYMPQPPDFPISREEPAYLKTVWIEVE
jgi:23S rRNA (cytosine1962-C5)-methyltransferase